MKVAIYCRVSTGRQTNENQKLVLEEHAKRSGWNYDIYEEKESTRNTRPIKEMLLKRLRAHEYDTVCVLKLDRWGRSTAEIARELEELYSKGIKFISIRDNIDLSTATGTLQMNMIAAFAQFERDIGHERVMDGIARAKAEGKHCGRPKGSKDKKQRIRSGYHLRHTAKKTREKYEAFV